MKFSSIQKLGESVLMNSLVTACSIFICISSNQSGCKIQFWGCCNTCRGQFQEPHSNCHASNEVMFSRSLSLSFLRPLLLPSLFPGCFSCLFSLSVGEMPLRRGREGEGQDKGWDIQVCTSTQKPPLVGKSVTV